MSNKWSQTDREYSRTHISHKTIQEKKTNKQTKKTKKKFKKKYKQALERGGIRKN